MYNGYACFYFNMYIDRHYLYGEGQYIVSTLRLVTAGLILLAVLFCVIWRPRNISVAWPASIGAICVIVFGLVQPSVLVSIWNDTWDASATLIALFLLSEALESNKFFDWAALHLARFARGSGWLLYMLILFLTTATTALLANDGAILILTPIFARLLVRIYDKATLQWLPYVLAAGFFADATSALFIPSNLTNIIIASANQLNFLQFAGWMVLPTVCAALAAGICFGWRFRTTLRANYDVTILEVPAHVLRDRVIFWASWLALLVLVAGYSIGGQFHLPVSVIAGPVALGMTLLVRLRRINTLREIILAAPWSILFYALGMFVVITAAFYTGVLTPLITPLLFLMKQGDPVLVVLGAGSIPALFAALANNLPATLVGVLTLRSLENPPILAIYALTLGVNIGPKLTPYGSLATLLWLAILTRNGIHISWRQYIRENWWVTIISLSASLAGLLFVRYLIA